MKDKNLLRISILTSIIGLISLFFITSFTQAQTIRISDIDDSYIGKTVSVQGEITSIFNAKGHYFISLKDGQTIKVVIFSNNADKLNVHSLEKGDKIDVLGKVDKYKGELEILPKDIEILS